MREITTAGLIEAFQSASGLPLHQVLQLGRYLRLAGFLPSSGRERSPPQIAPVHGAAMIVAGLLSATCPALHIDEQLPRFFAMPAIYGPAARYFDFITPSPELPKLKAGEQPATLGQVIELLLLAVHHPDPKQRAAFGKAAPHVSLLPEAGRVVLRINDRTEVFGLPPESLCITSTGRLDNGGIWTTRTASTSLIRAVGDLVEINRRTALERNYDIPTVDARAALERNK